ncbi:DUF2919 family protein [Thalassomonas sp. M1454]|uniref:DUF2919 family protein n=1 Tax=Thalassomonas sp. M1454 TaxID=2594477 RepID=UPI00117CEFC4|nr:DUF2919 domain-containing protein [Thalassomonas sp. M1454]
MHPLASYSLKHFDKYNCLKLSFIYYFILIFLLRGFVIAILSLVNLRDKLALIQWFYPESSQFYFALLSSTPSLLLFYVIIQRKPEAAPWVKSLWQNILPIMSVFVLLDLAIYWGQFALYSQGKFNWLCAQTFIAVCLLLFCKLSAKARINRSEFPETIPKAPRKKRDVVY